MRLKHKKKVKMARKMMSREEIKRGVNIFDSEAWNNRADQRNKKELARIKNKGL